MAEEKEVAFSIRVPESLAKQIDEIADRQKRSKNSLILILLEDAIKKVK